MGSFDTVTWQALTLVLTLAGLVGTVAFWRLRGPASGLRTLGVALLPAAAYLTGTLRLLWEVGGAVVRWAAGLTFGLSVWLGLGVAATSLVLFAVAGRLGRRGHDGRGGRGRGRAPEVTGTPAGAVTSRADGRGTANRAPVDDDMADIEEILRRHGIT